MENIEAKMSWLGGKYLLSEIKKEKNDLLYHSSVLRTYSKNYEGKEVQTKTYFDTQELFFNKNGISISISNNKGEKTSSLVVRYHSDKERISYLSYMPDTYETTIDLKSPIQNHFHFIAKAVRELIINGLEVDILDVLKEIKPIMLVKKKREKYRISGMNQLRLYFYFDNCEYQTSLARGKEKMDIFEIVCENEPKEFEEIYNKVAKDIVVENPTIVETSHSDLDIGLSALVTINKI